MVSNKLISYFDLFGPLALPLVQIFFDSLVLIFYDFYMAVFSRDVLWYGTVCPSIRPFVRPSVRLLARKNI